MSRMVKIVAAVLISIGLFSSCSGDDNSGGSSGVAPSSTQLVFPENNMECTEGTAVNDSQSTVVFKWNTSENTNSYEVNLKNLDTNTAATKSATTNTASITLERDTPYEWYVVSKSNSSSATAKSDTWRFYNQGLGVINYAPFPAVAVSPTRGQTVTASGTITLEWEGSDVDDDIDEFEVFLGTSNNPTTSIGSTSLNSMSVSINSGTTYYWRVSTTDNVGNTSQSEVFNFKVQ